MVASTGFQIEIHLILTFEIEKEINRMKTNKHIALWTCPRSRSTLMTRAFEELEGCLIFDEPLYAPYLLK